MIYTRIISSDITKTIEIDRVDVMPTECPLIKLNDNSSQLEHNENLYKDDLTISKSNDVNENDSQLSKE